MNTFFTRAWDVVVGSLMVVLGVAFQLIFYVLLLFPGFYVLTLLGIDPKGPFWTGALMASYAVLFNAVTCFEYFRRRTVNVGAGDASQFFLLPRGIDRIFFGRDLAVATPSQADDA